MTPAAGWLPGQSVSLAVPASSANLGPGFDSIGVALEVLDRCTVAVSTEPGVRVRVSGEGAGELPTDARHLVVRAMHRAWQVIGCPPPAGLELDCVNQVPHARGMGSSATAIVTGIAAAYALRAVAQTGEPHLDLDRINDLAADMEGHPDNSSASVFGAMTLSWQDGPAPSPGAVAVTSTVRLAIHPELVPVVMVPQAQLSTATARSVLPTHVRLGDAAANSARAALLVHAATTDPALLLPATRDWLHQEPRRPSYPASMALLDRLRAGGYAATISGAGPSVLVLCRRADEAAVTGYADADWQALAPGFARAGVRIEASAQA